MLDGRLTYVPGSARWSDSATPLDDDNGSTVVDTTGAGDAFIGCLLYQISDLGNFEPVFEDFSLLEKMVATANKAGAITTTNYGAIVALPTKDQLDK